MAQLQLTQDEKTLLLDAIEQSIGSAKRQQNMKGKTITIKTVYEQHERTLQALKTKVAELK